MNGLNAGPVPDGRQQEAGNHRHAVAVDHFMGVPLRSRQPGHGRGNIKGIYPHPKQHRRDGVHGRREKKRPESQIEQGKPRRRCIGFVHL